MPSLEDSSKSISYSSLFVNTFFESFLRFFKPFFFHRFLTFFSLFPGLPLRARIYYHLHPLLSTLFTNFFVTFALYLSLSLRVPGRFCVQAAMVHYMLCPLPLFVSPLYIWVEPKRTINILNSRK